MTTFFVQHWVRKPSHQRASHSSFSIFYVLVLNIILDKSTRLMRIGNCRCQILEYWACFVDMVVKIERWESLLAPVTERAQSKVKRRTKETFFDDTAPQFAMSGRSPLKANSTCNVYLCYTTYLSLEGWRNWVYPNFATILVMLSFLCRYIQQINWMEEKFSKSPLLQEQTNFKSRQIFEKSPDVQKIPN